MSKIGEEGRGERVELTIRPLTPQAWPAFEDLLADGGATRRCWCMYWQVGALYRRRPAEENRDALRDRVRAGPPPGLVAFDGELAVGWCQVTPRSAIPALAEMWRLRPADGDDDAPVWSISCLYVRKGYRRRGVTSALVAEAVEVVRRAGGAVVEAYPFDADASPSATGTGYASTFAKAGFTTVARRVPARPIVRLHLRG